MYAAPMMVKVPITLRNQLKDFSSKYGSIRSLFDAFLTDFLDKKPWANDPYFCWIVAPKVIRENPKWILLNVVSLVPLTVEAKTISAEMDISLQTFLLSGLTWWYHLKVLKAEKEKNLGSDKSKSKKNVSGKIGEVQ
jgi:hypothetical protein